MLRGLPTGLQVRQGVRLESLLGKKKKCLPVQETECQLKSAYPGF